MHLIDLATKQHVEARYLAATEVLVRGEIGGLTPTITTPRELAIAAVVLEERRVGFRRVGPVDRRRNRRADRRKLGLLLQARGRRRNDAIPWSLDEAEARARHQRQSA